MYKVKNKLSPPFMQEIFEHNGFGRATRMGDKFIRPHINKVYTGENFLRNFGPVVWNSELPEKQKSCSSLSAFKNSIKSWIPDNCPCILCKNYVKGVGFIRKIWFLAIELI